MSNVRFLFQPDDNSFVYRPPVSLEHPIALDSTPSEACKAYHESYCIQINLSPELKNKFLKGEESD